MQCTCRQTYIILYTNIAESRIERDYWPRYAHAARQLISFVSAANSSVSFGFACTYVYGREGGGLLEYGVLGIIIYLCLTLPHHMNYIGRSERYHSAA